MAACSKNDRENFSPVLLPEGAISIVGANNGGNITCEEVGNFPFSSGRIDYDGETGGTFGPITWWTDDGIYVNWTSPVPLKIAVIVKGGPNAAVWPYECATSGTALSAPINPDNGKPYGLSNITFCYSYCDLVIAFKSYMTKDLVNMKQYWAVTSGGPGDIDFVAYYDFVPNYIGNKIYFWDYSTKVGNITVSDLDGDNLMEVKIDNLDWPEMKFTDAYLYVGSFAGFSNWNFENFPYKTGLISPTSSVIFELPF